MPRTGRLALQTFGQSSKRRSAASGSRMKRCMSRQCGMSSRVRRVNAVFVDPQQVAARAAHQDRRVRRHQRLRSPVPAQPVQQAEQRHLPLRRQPGLRLVQDEQQALAGVDPGRQQGQHALAAALLVRQAPLAAGRHRQPPGPRHRVREPVRPQEQALRSAPGERHLDRGGERRRLALVLMLGVAAPAAGADGAARRDRLQQRRLARAVLPGQERERAARRDLDRAVR